MKPLILGEWGTPHTTRPGNLYKQVCIEPVVNLDDVPENNMGPNKTYFAAVPVSKFLNEQWDTIKGNLANKDEQVCVGGFIFDWSDEYWKAGDAYISRQVGGPNPGFNGGAFAGGYWDEAGFGVTSAVDLNLYGSGKPNISRSLFKGYFAVKEFYNASSHTGKELYARESQKVRSRLTFHAEPGRTGVFQSD